MKNFLIPECYTEQEILLILGFNRKEQINKASGCSSVISRIKKTYDKRLAIGWIDQDPTKQSNRGEDYQKYRLVDSKYKVRLLAKPDHPHYLIEIEPDFERWIEPLGKAKGIKKEDFNIKYTLHECAKVEIKPNVRRYFEAVKDANPEPFNHIRSIIDGILEKHKQ